MDNGAEIKYHKKNKHNKTDPPRDARIDAHLNLKRVSWTRTRRQTDRRTDGRLRHGSCLVMYREEAG